MCGFAGHYKTIAPYSRPALKSTVRAMNDVIAHRGPDSHGVWLDPDMPLALGHRRLAIIDLSPHGHQPMISASERYVMLYNGEVYNFMSLQKELERAGLSFKGRGDTEVILAAIEYWGLNMTLQKINGMFAIALWDRKTRQMHFVRDRMGKKPLYIGWAGKSLVFGSELKALHAHEDFTPEINREALALFMRHSYTPAPLSIYKNVWSLPAGMRLSLSLDNLKSGRDLSRDMEPYWSHLNALEEARGRSAPASDAQAIDEFESLLSTCVHDRMISDVPLGAFLSGGIDSSAVVAMMQKTSGPRTKTYSIGFEETGFDEATYAKKVAQHLDTDHHELYVSGKDALSVIPKLPQIYDEPFADISAIPTYLVSAFARKSVTVALSGDGGDEMLGGYRRHFMGPRIWNKLRFMPAPLRKIMGAGIGAVPVEYWDAIKRGTPQFGTYMHKLAAILDASSPEEIYRTLTSHWRQSPVLGAGAEYAAQTPLEKASGALPDISYGEAMMFWDALSYLPNDILVKVDRASMAVSLEARAPLLDKRIYDYVWSLPPEMKIRDGQGKWLLRRVLERHVPKELFERPKQGFNIPVGEWLRGPLKDWAESLLDEKTIAAQGYLDSAMITRTWQAHLKGHGNHATKLWNVLMFQAWLERWN